MDDMKLTFEFERSTKGAHRFQEVDSKGNALSMQESSIGTIYVRKVKMPEAPKKLTITVSDAPDS